MADRRNFIKAVGSLGLLTGIAGCAGLGTQGVPDKSDGDYKYVTNVEQTVIGSEEGTQSALRLTLTDFATSKHSAGETILILHEDTGSNIDSRTMSQSVIPNNSNTLVVPVNKIGNVEDVAVVDDENNVLETQSY